MRAPFALAVLSLAIPLEAAAEQWDLQGAASGRAFAADGPQAWIDGGFGRLLEGGTPAGGRDAGLRGELQLGLDWKPSETWLFHTPTVSSTPRARGPGCDGRFVEGFVQSGPS